MKKYLYATLILCAAIFISSCSMASGGGSGSSGDSGGTQSGGNTGSGSSAITVTADNAAQTIAALTENSTVVLTGSVNSSQLTAIKNAINSGSHNVNLDLSNTIGLTSIGNSAFEWCSKLSGIALPSSVTSIGEQAFSFCEYLTQLSIPSSVTSIGEKAFFQCPSLTQLTFAQPYSLTSIGNYAFSCSALTQISIPSSVTSIGDYAFFGSDNLTSITFEDTSTWYRTEDATDLASKSGGTETDVSNPANNAEYFQSDYLLYYFYKL